MYLTLHTLTLTLFEDNIDLWHSTTLANNIIIYISDNSKVSLNSLQPDVVDNSNVLSKPGPDNPRIVSKDCLRTTSGQLQDNLRTVSGQS